ncbi:MAG TPA: PAS domain-containing protein [Hanamia sp.]|nr:PAS domain-containing protein [Hanamia sp.]
MNEPTYLPTRKNNYVIPPNESKSHDLDVIEKAKHASASEIYDGLFQNAFQAMYVENHDGIILKFNKQFCKLFGYSDSEMSKVENEDLFVMDEKPFLRFLDERNKKRIAKGEITGIKKTGKKFPCRISSVIYESEYGDTRTMNTLVDISGDLSARWNF